MARPIVSYVTMRRMQKIVITVKMRYCYCFISENVERYQENRKGGCGGLQLSEVGVLDDEMETSYRIIHK